MELSNFIRIERSRCVRCLQCLRSCDVNAIRYVDNDLVIKPNRCIKCGKCYEQCPNGSVEIRHYLRSAQQTVVENEIVVASISPTWVSEFKGVTMSQIVNGLKILGFTHVSQAVHGATKVIEETKRHFNKNTPFVISSLCPVVNSLIEIYYPDFTKYLNPVSTPETIHAKMIREWYGQEAKVIAISSCVAQKGNKNFDAAITFSALKDWFADQNIDVKSLPSNSEDVFEPFLATDNHGYQLVSSAINYFPSIDVQSASGIVRVKKMLEDIDVNGIVDNIYLELFACEGGCLTSVGSVDKNNMLVKKLLFDKHIRDSKQDHKNTLPDVEYERHRTSRMVDKFASEQQIESILRTMNISGSGSLLNCGACGYHTCHDFANAVVTNMAEINTCVWHQKNCLSNNLKKLIEYIPFGIFVVDNNLDVINVNSQFCDGVGVSSDALKNPNVALEALLPFTDQIKSMLDNPTGFKTYDIDVANKKMRLKLFSLQDGVLVCGTLRNRFASASYDDSYVQSVRNVIQDNLVSVQQIAYLLGENVSRTESLLSSILESKD